MHKMVQTAVKLRAKARITLKIHTKSSSGSVPTAFFCISSAIEGRLAEQILLLPTTLVLQHCHIICSWKRL